MAAATRTLDTVTDAARFFLEPGLPRQHQYEALRAYFAEGAPSAEVALRFGYQPGAFRVLCWRFRHQMDRDFFRASAHGPTTQPRKDAVRAHVIALRKRNFSVYDIRDELERAGPARLSVTAIHECSAPKALLGCPAAPMRSARAARGRRPTPSPMPAPSPWPPASSPPGPAGSFCSCP